MMNPYNYIGEIQFLLSAVFIFMGAFVFFISSLISGHNIFRDISLEVGLMVTSIVGFVLFVYSPISFLVLAPNLFLSSSPYSEKVWLEIHQLIRYHFFWPFILSAVGFGVVFGALEAINARTLFLRWLRRNIKIRYAILSYEKSWDNFFLSLKRGGLISLFRKSDGKEICTGHLYSGSIKDEQKEIVIKCHNKYQLIDASDIAYVEAPSKSFHRHIDVVPHQIEAFYLAISVLGLLLLARSSSMTASYLMSNFKTLGSFYQLLNLVLLILAFFFSMISFQASRYDFRNLCSYITLCPAVPTFLLLDALGGFILIWRNLIELHSFQSIANNPPFYWISRIDLSLIAILFILFIFYRRHKRQKVESVIASIAPEGPERELLLKVCQFIYLEIDLNRSEPTQWLEMEEAIGQPGSSEVREQYDLREMMRNLRKEISRLVQNEKFLWVGRTHYLEGEDYNIVYRLLRTLEKEQDKILPLLQGASTDKIGTHVG